MAQNCILSSDQTLVAIPLVINERGTSYQPSGVVEWIKGKSGDDPRYRSAPADWDGNPFDAFISERFGPETGWR